MLSLSITDDAWADVTSARQFYQTREAWVADYFLETFLAEADSLTRFHGKHRKLFGLHKVKVGKFPAALYYRETAQEVVVVAVLDQRRDPQWIRRQLRTR